MNWSLWAVELCHESGPTGEFREVLQLAIRDKGGNELWRGKPGQQPQYDYRVPHDNVATLIGRPVVGGDYLADWHD